MHGDRSPSRFCFVLFLPALCPDFDARFLLAKENHRRLGNGEAPKRLVVLGATSGDTGSAAIEGLRGKRNIDVFILFPQGRVAPVQEAQMTTVADSNVHCVAVDGVFDDCQDVVKKLFCDKNFNNATPPNPDAEGDDPLAENTESEHSVTLGAVNSINWARILAQIVYYFYGYFRWLDLSSAEARPRTLGEDKVTFAVPSGNFGNALAGFYARSMGLPIHRLVRFHARCNSRRFTVTNACPLGSSRLCLRPCSNFPGCVHK